MKRFWLFAILISIYGALASCSGTRVLLKTAPSNPKGVTATPNLPVTTLANWEATGRDQIRTDLETHIYGTYPDYITLSRKDQTRIDGTQFDGSAQMTLETLTISNPNNGQSRDFGLVLLHPAGAKADIPVIMVESFCPNHIVIPHPDVPRPRGEYPFCEGGDGVMDALMEPMFDFFFGRYITTPPLAEVMNRGYALAAIFPSEFIPDNAAGGTQNLNSFFSDQPAETRTQAIVAWAAQFSKLSDYLKTDKGYIQTITFGHSRYGKAALIAAAYDDTIDAVLSHQSGTGGASLAKDKDGETIADITQGYPHWFNDKYASYADDPSALPLDQHFLLALVAPRPVLLGNARRDVWSDPNGAFRAAEAARQAYALYGSEGLRQTSLKAFDPEADMSFWLRPGTHGVVKEDWPAFLDFLDAHIDR